jgi:ankyrin repeat protein
MISKDQIAMVDCLLKSGKLDPNMYGVEYHQGYHSALLLYFAAARGRTEIVGLLLGSSTIDPKLVPDKNTSPLSITALRDQVKTAEKLLKCPEIIVDGKFDWEQEITTLLHVACCGGHVETIRLMLKVFDDRGLHVNSLDKAPYRRTPLQHAVVFGHTQAVELLLLRQDIDVNQIVRSSSMSLWQVAAHGGHAKTLSVLLGDSRVNRHDTKNSRQSLLFEATSGGHWCLADILFNYGKVPLDTTCRDLSVSKEPFRRHIDILERYLNDVAFPPSL